MHKINYLTTNTPKRACEVSFLFSQQLRQEIMLFARWDVGVESNFMKILSLGFTSRVCGTFFWMCLVLQRCGEKK